jgi:amidase
VKNMRITLGLVGFADTTSKGDAVAVQSLREAGAVVYVKTTMPQTGMVRRRSSKPSQS